MISWNTRWKQIYEYPDYWVSADAKPLIFNMRTGRLQYIGVNNKGTRVVQLSNNSYRRKFSVKQIQRNTWGKYVADITFLKIEPKTENPWETIFYMCGACGHAVKLTDTLEHALIKHDTEGVKLYSQGKDWVEDNNA